jgi:hypothetical protein
MRPLGVSLIGLYQFLRCFIGLVFGVFIVFFVGPSNKLASVAAQGNSAERWIGGFGHAAGWVVILFALVHLLSGYGVLRVQNWGRFLTLLLSAVELALLLPAAGQANTFLLLFGVLNAVSIFYLAMPPVGRVFHEHAIRMRMAF